MRSRAVALLVVAVFATGCGSDERPVAQDAEALEGHAWVLAGGIDVAGWQDVAPSAVFTGKEIQGRGGCNELFAEYAVDGTTLKVGGIGTTDMACGDPGDAVEQAFMQALWDTRGWRVDDGTLTLVGADDQTVLQFREGSPVGAWKVVSFRHADDSQMLSEAIEITATFSEDGTLTGSSGCNRYTAAYTRSGNALTIEPPSATEQQCSDPASVMEEERAYLEAVAKAASYRIEGRRLELLTRDGAGLASLELTRNG